MLMTDDCSLFQLFISSFSSSAIKCDPLVFIWCLCIWCLRRETVFSWFYPLLLVFIPCTEHFQRKGSEYMYSYFLSTLSDLPTLSWCGWLRRAPTPWMQAAVFVWQQDKSWIDSLRGCGPALMPWKEKRLIVGVRGGALPSWAVSQTTSPALKIKKIQLNQNYLKQKYSHCGNT